MKILIVGGTGLVGAHAALYLHKKGHVVTIASRNPPATDSPLAGFPFLSLDYQDESVSVDSLRGFDWLLFAAGADLRQQPADASDEDFFHAANSVAIPAFFAKAKEAGIRRVVYIGTYYPQVAPEKIQSSAYVRSRHLADEAVRTLSTEDFAVASLNAPFILGYVQGVNAPHLEALVQYVAGRIPGMSPIAPAGGVNHIAVESLSEAILGAFENAEPGRAYLVGDENLSWKQYLEKFCELAGNPQELSVTEDEHPLFPDIMLYAGRNALIEYEPENGELNYSRQKVVSAMEDVVRAYL